MKINSFLSEMTTSTKLISWATLALSIGYAILLVQPQPQLNLAELHKAAANYMGAHPSSPTPLKGLTVAITGATSGIGFELTRHLTGMGAHVVAIGRSPSKLQVLASEVDHVSTILADLTDLESVARAANEISTNVPHLDILINNAGMHAGTTVSWPWKRPSTAQGYDLVFGGTYDYIII
jgi:NADPH:quinone reductase-like Zn-dependent oxidoreductase